MSRLLEDVRYAFRLLRKSPGFTLIAVLTLALGIGANTAVFSVVNGVLLRPLSYPEPDRLIRVWERTRAFEQNSVAYLNYVDWRKDNRTCEEMGALRSEDFNMTGNGVPERLKGVQVSASMLRVVGMTPLRGRTISEEEDRAGGAPVALISEGLWQRRFGSAPGILGRKLTLNGTPHTVVGIVPASFQLPDRERIDVFTPLGQAGSLLLQDRETHPGIQVIGRLKPGATEQQARADMVRIAASLERAYPKENTGHSATVLPLKESVVGDVRPILLVLTGAVVLVLLIACANVANLMLSRATARQKEMAVRTALGAGRFQILRQLLTESAILSVLGGAAGLVVASWGMGFLLKAVPTGLPRMEQIGIDGRVLAFTLLVSLGTGMLFGMAPALTLARSEVRAVLVEAGRGMIGGSQRLRDLLVVGETALALVLLVGGGLMIQSIWRLSGVNPGLNPHHVLAFNVALSPAKMASPATERRAYTQMIERIRRTSGIEAAAVMLDMPFSDDDWETDVWIDGTPQPKSTNDLPLVLTYYTTPEYLRVMRIPLVRGRYFNEFDTSGKPPVMVIDEVMARSLFPGQDPIGRYATIGGMGEGAVKAQIVGIVGHVRHWGLERDATATIRAQMYAPMMQIPDQYMSFVSSSSVVLRTAGEPLQYESAVRAQVLGSDRDQPVWNMKSMDSMIADTMAERRFSMLLLGTFAAIALLLASVGIYGVISYLVSQRTREVGIRLALGARTEDVLKLVVGRGALLALAGVGIGMAAALAATQALSKMLFGVSATDPLTYTAVAVVLAAVAVLASYLPARRAAGIDPMVALRYE
ncbi:MAG TPA: ABC transporter permease [Candidatus Acidoferrum sp.]|nr:ABC transporter permease [Candidatus Acidoferrum sp.]